MSLLNLIRRQPAPAPWSEGDNIPWHEPAFSARMLEAHLSQAHDRASRRFSLIAQQVAWIHETLLGGEATRILDLGCGPGLYTSRLAKLGHECVGVDFSPASIRYAREVAEREPLRCTYIEQDVRAAEFGSGFGLVMLLFGELNVFKPADARAILMKAQHALEVGGMLLLEPHTFAAIQRMGETLPTWYTSERGLFGDVPYICLTEHFWDARQCVATMRYFVMDAASGNVARYAQSMRAYTDDEYRALLSECGFGGVEFYEAVGDTEKQEGLMAIVARR